MKKTTIAALISGLSLMATAPAYANVVLYNQNGTILSTFGHMQGIAINTPSQTINGQNISSSTVDDSSVKVALQGSHQINSNLKVLGFWKEEFAAFNNDGGANTTNQAYAGIDSTQYGQLIYGRLPGAVDHIKAFTNTFPIWGSSANNNVYVGNEANGMLGYQNTLGHFTVYANYRLTNKPDTAANGNAHAKTGYAASAIYNFDNGFAVGAGYTRQKNTDWNINGATSKMKDTDNTMLAASYSNTSWYLAALLSVGHQDTSDQFGQKSAFANKVKPYEGYELVAQYLMTPNWQLGTTYNMGDYRDLNTHLDYVNYLDFNVTYTVQQNFKAYASYMWNLINDKTAQEGDFSNANQIGLGMTYYF